MDDRLLTVEESLDYLREIGKTKRRVKRDTFMSWVDRGLLKPVSEKPYRFDVRDLHSLVLPTPGGRRGRPPKRTPKKQVDPDALLERLKAKSW